MHLSIYRFFSDIKCLFVAYSTLVSLSVIHLSIFRKSHFQGASFVAFFKNGFIDKMLYSLIPLISLHVQRGQGRIWA
jgi:hypothetical protein